MRHPTSEVEARQAVERECGKPCWAGWDSRDDAALCPRCVAELAWAELADRHRDAAHAAPSLHACPECRAALQRLIG